MIDLLKQEHCTWSLLTSLYKDRLQSELQNEQMQADETMVIDSLVKLLCIFMLVCVLIYIYKIFLQNFLESWKQKFSRNTSWRNVSWILVVSNESLDDIDSMNGIFNK